MKLIWNFFEIWSNGMAKWEYRFFSRIFFLLLVFACLRQNMLTPLSAQETSTELYVFRAKKGMNEAKKCFFIISIAQLVYPVGRLRWTAEVKISFGKVANKYGNKRQNRNGSPCVENENIARKKSYPDNGKKVQIFLGTVQCFFRFLVFYLLLARSN